MSATDPKRTCDRFYTAVHLDCETRKLDNPAWRWRHKSAMRSVLSHMIPTCKPPLSSVATDQEAF